MYGVAGNTRCHEKEVTSTKETKEFAKVDPVGFEKFAGNDRYQVSLTKEGPDFISTGR